MVTSNSHPIEFIVEATRIAHWVSIVVPPPQHCLSGLAVTALVIHTF